MQPRASLLRLRLQSVLTAPMALSFLALYAGALCAVVAYRNWMLLTTSFLEGYEMTALRAMFKGVGDAYSRNPQDIAVHAALILISLNVVLGVSYIARIGTLAQATKPIGMGVGATVVFLLGLGCLSCGAVLGLILSSLFGAAFLQTFVVWGGPVLLWAGVVALSALALMVAKKVTDPFVC